MCCRRPSTFYLSILCSVFGRERVWFADFWMVFSCWHHFSTYQPETSPSLAAQMDGREAETEVHVSGVS